MNKLTTSNLDVFAKKQKNPVRFRHLHDVNGKITSTIATQYTDNSGNTLVYAVARCSPGETSPSRKMGRTIAGGRLRCYLNGRNMNNNAGTVSRQNFIRWLQESKKQLEENLND